MSFSSIFSKIDELPKAAPIDDQSEGFEQLRARHKISPDEYQRLLKILGRSPTFAELGIFSSMWSEHCSYKSSRVHLGRFPTEGPHVVVGPGENAGVVRLGGKLCIAFKMESHNHPSYIEPYQGAATGVGGILRDVFCMGARPIANLNALRFGRRDHPRTPYLLEYVVRGIGDYGNCIGVPTVGGNISFDASYDGNCLVNAMTIGLVHEDRIFKGYATGQGNLVVYLGSATGRDGIHGATMASGSFDSSAAGERSTVQVGDPFTEKLLLEATLEALDQDLVVGLQDMGAAGLTSSAFEMAGRAGNGLFMDLDQVPVRTTAMSAYELLLSESQERMLMVVEPAKWPTLKRLLAKWELACTVIGEVTGTGRVQIHRSGLLEADIPVGPITDEAPRYERPMRARTHNTPVDTADSGQPTGRTTDQTSYDEVVASAIAAQGAAAFLELALADTGSKQPIYQQYDHHIGVRTVLGPEHEGAAVLWTRQTDWSGPGSEYLGVVVAAACNERYCRMDPRQGAAHAVAKTARMIAACGGEPLAITDCLNYGNPEVPEVMWELSEGVDGISEACRALDVQVVSGNVSLYNETDGRSIAPTPMIGMVGRHDDVRKGVPAVAKGPGVLLLLGPKKLAPTFGGSLAAKLTFALNKRSSKEAIDRPGTQVDGHSSLSLGGTIPPIDWEVERQAIAFLKELTSADLGVTAVRDCGDGGIAVTAAKFANGGELELELTLQDLEWEASFDNATCSFGELAATYLLAIKEEHQVESVAAAVAAYNQLTVTAIGELRVSRVSP